MNIQYQDIGIAKKKIIKMWTANPNRSISSTFRTIRNKSYVSFFGDYPILSAIINTLSSLNIIPSRFQITYALNQSDELRYFSKEAKTELLNQLIKPSNVQIKVVNNCPRKKKNRDLINVLSEKNNNKFYA